MSVSSLKMPEAVVLDEANYTNSFGRFTLQPLERGFGVTLGNSLRRVLLSSLQGAAITSVKFSGVLHEFTTIEGVVEDVSEIILNLKQVRMKFLSKKPNKIDISLAGAGVWTAGDLQKASNEVEILNPELHIATLNKSAKLDVEIRVGKGVGYVPAQENIVADQTIGVIPIDSIFTPIKLVKYDVENVRIGDKNDFEKLFLKFSRIPNALSQKEGGTGLGLFLAKKLAEAHQGSIEVISEDDRGSEFILSIPAKLSNQ